MHPEIISLCLFMFVTSCSPGPNNIVASYSGFNFGILKTIPHMCGVVFGFTTLVAIMNFGLLNIFQRYISQTDLLIFLKHHQCLLIPLYRFHNFYNQFQDLFCTLSLSE